MLTLLKKAECFCPLTGEKRYPISNGKICGYSEIRIDTGFAEKYMTAAFLPFRHRPAPYNRRAEKAVA